jgi:hypothetical protein
MKPYFFIQLSICAALAFIATRLSARRDIRSFLLVILAVWVVASIGLSFDDFSRSRYRIIASTVAWCLSMALIYAVVPGVLVAQGRRAVAIWFASAAAFAVQFPLSLVSALYIGCYVGHDCP